MNGRLPRLHAITDERIARRPDLVAVATALATAALTVALAAQAVGYNRGFGAATFRAVQLGAQLLAPLALTWP